jgi:probable F420-dependent oxidoreductase
MKFFTSLGFNQSLTELALTAEAAGFEGTTLPDHLFFPKDMHSRYPYSPDGKVYWDGEYPWPDVWVTTAAMAAVTTRLRFITSIYILPLRHPFVVAKSVGTAAALSQGRVILGAALGWMRDEFDQLGVDFSTRGQRADEMIPILRLLWGGGMVEYHGKHFDFGPLQMSPAPQVPVPIYLGGESDAALRRAARLADGYISVPHDDLEEIAILLRRLTSLRAEAGRADHPFEFLVIAPVPGDADQHQRLADLGVAGVISGPPVGPEASIEEHCDALMLFGQDVIATVS